MNHFSNNFNSLPLSRFWYASLSLREKIKII